MPNRLIKESITMSEDIAELSFGAEVLFYRLMVKADDYGAYYGDERILQNTLFPLQTDKVKQKNIRAWIEELEKHNLIFQYDGPDGKRYVQITKWNAHQRIRAKKSRYPRPDYIGGHMTADDSTCQQLTADDRPIQSNPIQSESESRIQSESESNSVNGGGGIDDFFSALLKEYPRKQGSRMVTDEAKAELMAAGAQKVRLAIQNYKRQIEEEQIEPKYIKCAHTFFNGEWRDYLDQDEQTEIRHGFGPEDVPEGESY